MLGFGVGRGVGSRGFVRIGVERTGIVRVVLGNKVSKFIEKVSEGCV